MRNRTKIYHKDTASQVTTAHLQVNIIRNCMKIYPKDTASTRSLRKHCLSAKKHCKYHISYIELYGHTGQTQNPQVTIENKDSHEDVWGITYKCILGLKKLSSVDQANKESYIQVPVSSFRNHVKIYHKDRANGESSIWVLFKIGKHIGVPHKLK